MPVMLDLPGMFLAGSVLALASRRRIRDDSVEGFSRHVRSALAFAGLYGLMAAVLAFWREDWMWSYLLQPPLPTMLWYLAYWGSVAGAAMLGAGLAQRAIRRHDTLWVVVYPVASFVVLAVVWLATLRAYTHFGSYAEYHDGLAYPLSQMPDTGRILLIGTLVNAGLLLLVLAFNWLMDRRARQRPTAVSAGTDPRIAELRAAQS